MNSVCAQRAPPTRKSGGLHSTVLTPFTIHVDGVGLAVQGRVRAIESEKVTINLGFVDLGQIDLMVQDGFYSNRTDFIRTAIRNQLDRHADVLQKSVTRRTLDLGLRTYTRRELEQAREAGLEVHIKVLGLASIAEDVPAELARETIASVSVLGALHASAEVRAALRDRMQ